MSAKMKILSLAAFCLFLCVLSLACDMKHGTTPIAAPVITYGGNFSFIPSAVTIKTGMSVIWDGSFNGSHTAYIDDAAGNCVTNFTSFPVTGTFSSHGTYHYHCQYHSPTCGTTICSAACTGMAGVIVV